MRNLDSIRIVGAVLSAALGLSALGCGGTTQISTSCDGGTCSSHGSSSRSSSSGSSSSTHGSSSSGYIACESPSPVVVAGHNTGFVSCSGNVEHRASVETCPSTLNVTDGGGACPIPHNDAEPPFMGECSSDNDCTAKPLGTCGLPGGGGVAAACICSYGCTQDSDCGPGAICLCGDPVGSCVPATCMSDNDCPTGSLCASNAASPSSCAGPGAFSCQSLDDACLSTNECTGPQSGASCVEQGSGAGMARTCVEEACAGGRPFLVDEVVRVAGVTGRRDWQASGYAPRVGSLDDVSRGLLADHWIRVARMEHASVAAFARFAMELLALGAPADLLVACSKAMADETEHARMAFALASAYAAKGLGPAALDVSGALRNPDARSVFATLVREGCVGETIAAVEATLAHAQATDPAVKGALAKIAADETSHAELAFRAARWLFESGDTAFREWAGREVTRAVSERRAVPRGVGRGFPEHGLLDGREQHALASQALTSLVEPCWQAIVAGVDAPKAVQRATV